jgi:hypothetical protein
MSPETAKSFPGFAGCSIGEFGNAFTLNELAVLTGFPAFFRQCINENKDPRWDYTRYLHALLAGGMRLKYVLKDRRGEKGSVPRLGFEGVFKEGEMFRKSSSYVNGFALCTEAIDAYLHFRRLDASSTLRWPRTGCHGGCAVFETDLAYIFYSISYPHAFCQSNDPGLCDLFFNGISMLLMQMYCDNGEQLLWGSITENMRHRLGDEYGALIAAEYWEKSEVCITLRDGWAALPEGTVLGRFGEQEFDLLRS